jgi:hypothetical protein
MSSKTAANNLSCVILQPSYIPWRGYFDMIYKSDIFVFYDDVQYDKHGWRNRNRIKTSSGSRWITIPVYAKNNIQQNIPINQVRIDWSQKWNQAHHDILRQSYKSAPYYKKYELLLKQLYNRKDPFLADFTIEFIKVLSQELGIRKTEFLRSSTLKVNGKKTDRLAEILLRLGATHYITGPSAKDYLEVDKLNSLGITVEFMSYNYPEYHQFHGPYDPQISILDLLFMVGPQVQNYIWADPTPLIAPIDTKNTAIV